MGNGRANLDTRPGPAAVGPDGQPAGRRQEADPIARVKRTARLWGTRFHRGLLPELERFASSIEIDFELYPYDIAGSIAHARGLAAANLLSPPRLASIERGLRRIKRELDGGEFKFEATDEDIHTAVERRLTELTPAGASLHAGRSRNDQVALDLRLYCRAAAAEAIAGLAQLAGALASSAAAHAAWLMPGYTHLQRAQPVTVGHHLLAHAEPLLRDAERFRHAYQSADEMPLGSGALAGSTLPLVRERVARELAFSRLTANSMDAVADRDFAMDLAYACATTAVHLSRLGEDIVIWASAEFGFVRLADEIATGSSLMPQKKNPDIAELLRGRAGRSLGALVALGTVLKGLPLAYDRDLQEDKVALFSAVDSALDSIRAAELLVRHLEFDRERLAAAAGDPGLMATDAAEDLVRSGMPFRRAHETVGRQVRDGNFVPGSKAAASLRKRDLPGAPHPRRVAARATEVRREATRLLRWSEAHPPALPK
ncbi:MAG TPA: argininosuccinate lyase [Candidatus Dormibacteraeota bacterium]